MAFISPLSISTPFLKPSAPFTSCNKCQCTRTITSKRITRRRSLHTIHMSDDPKPEETPTNPSDEVEPDSNIEISDLSLPNLRELFEGAGDPNCGQCSGKGEISCPVCQAKGFISLTMMDTVSSAPCRMCHGQCIIPCPSCRQIVYKSITWWDRIPSKEDDPDEKWREGPDGEPRIPWGDNPADS